MRDNMLIQVNVTIMYLCRNVTLQSLRLVKKTSIILYLYYSDNRIYDANIIVLVTDFVI